MANEKRLADLVKEAMAEAFKVYDADDHEELAEWIANWLELNWVTIQKNPTVEAVEVVRCKDCKHGVWDEEEQMWKCVYSAEFDDDISEWLGFYEFNEGEHFCSRGERKDNV